MSAGIPYIIGTAKMGDLLEKNNDEKTRRELMETLLCEYAVSKDPIRLEVDYFHGKDALLELLAEFLKKVSGRRVLITLLFDSQHINSEDYNSHIDHCLDKMGIESVDAVSIKKTQSWRWDYAAEYSELNKICDQNKSKYIMASENDFNHFRKNIRYIYDRRVVYEPDCVELDTQKFDGSKKKKTDGTVLVNGFPIIGEKTPLEKYSNLVNISKLYNKSLKQIVLNYYWERKRNVLPLTPVIECTSAEQARYLIDSFSFLLTKDEIAQLSEVGSMFWEQRKFYDLLNTSRNVNMETYRILMNYLNSEDCTIDCPEEVAIWLLEKYHNIFKSFAPELRKNKNVIKTAVCYDAHSLYYISDPQLYTDKEFIKELIHINSYAINCIPPKKRDSIKDDVEIKLAIYKITYASSIVDRLKSKNYERYKSKVLDLIEDEEERKAKDNDWGFLHYMLTKTRLLEYVYVNSNYSINDVKFIERIIDDYPAKEKEALTARINKIKEKEIAKNQCIMLSILNAVGRAENLDEVLSHYGLHKDNVIEFVINNKFYEKSVKKALILAIKGYYKEDCITIGDIIMMIDEMAEYELTIDQVLAIKGMDKATFRSIYESLKVTNPEIYMYIEENLDNNKRRGFVKFIRKGQKILRTPYNSLEEIEDELGQSANEILHAYEKTDLYDKLQQKFSSLSSARK